MDNAGVQQINLLTPADFWRGTAGNGQSGRRDAAMASVLTPGVGLVVAVGVAGAELLSALGAVSGAAAGGGANTTPLT